MTRPKPNLFVIGAAKSGTTSMHHHLARHPDIYMSDIKEPGYFAEGFNGFPKDETWYLSLFEKGDSVRYRGESSTHYTKLPVYTNAAERIAAYCDTPQFIYLMRDPIERAISQYWHHTRQNTEFRPPLRAMKENVEYKSYGDYARQLKPFLRIFSKSQVFTATFERLIQSPGDVTARIFNWLGLDPDRAPGQFPAENRSPRTIERLALGQKVGEFLHKSNTWESLSPLIPQSVKDLGKQLSTREFTPSDRSMEEVVEYLLPWSREVMKRTGDLLERDFPEWTTTLDQR